MKKQLLLIFIILLATPPQAFAKTTTAIVTMKFDLSRQATNKETRLWIPYPVSSKYQDISDINIKGDFGQSAVYTDKNGTPVLYAQWSAGSAERHLEFTFKAVRQEVIRRDFPANEGAWEPADYTQWLSPSSLGPIDGPVKELADRIVQDKTTVLSKAKAIYNWTCDNMYRQPSTIGCGKGDVCSLLKTPGGKCTDIHSVFVALCRAAGVPAREIFGIRLGKKEVQDITKWQHCWAEFFLPGYGWVPVDPADVRKLMLKQNLKLDDPKTAELRNYFWGGWDEYRVKLAMGRDIILNPAQQGGPINTLGYPYAEVGGKALDFYDPATFKYSFTTYRQRH